MPYFIFPGVILAFFSALASAQAASSDPNPRGCEAMNEWTARARQAMIEAALGEDEEQLRCLESIAAQKRIERASEFARALLDLRAKIRKEEDRIQESPRPLPQLMASVRRCVEICLPPGSAVHSGSILVVEVEVAEDGEVIAARLARQTGLAKLDRCVFDAVKKGWFSPGLRGRNTVKAKAAITVHLCPR